MKEKTTTEFEIEVSGGRIVGENLPLKDGRYKVWANEIMSEGTGTVPTVQKNAFVKVEASKLSLDDTFMKYLVETKNEHKFKEEVRMAIQSGLKDFYIPKYAPSLAKDGHHICFASGKRPAVGKCYNWWEEAAKNYAPAYGSRLGTKHEYIAFLAVLIKELVASGKSYEWAWNAVCNDSKELGHYSNSINAKKNFELTGRREVCGWCDLGNAYKILAEDKEAGGFWLAGGSFCNLSYCYPLAVLCLDYCRSNAYYYSCGWLVFDSCPDY